MVAVVSLLIVIVMLLVMLVRLLHERPRKVNTPLLLPLPLHRRGVKRSGSEGMSEEEERDAKQE